MWKLDVSLTVEHRHGEEKGQANHAGCCSWLTWLLPRPRY
jgi:hypothetical protein